MTEYIKKIVIISSCILCLIVLILIALFVDLDLKIIKFNSIKTLFAKHEEIVKEEENLTKKENEYNLTLKKVKDAEKTFEDEKAEYEAITDDTINIIKEATTEENYNIEYMWIRLGNYAKINNLSIIMVEPGGTFEEESAEKDGSSNTTGTSTTNNTTTSTGNANEKEQNNLEKGLTTINNANDEYYEKKENETNTNTNTNTSNDTVSNTSSDTIFKIQVSGSYLDVSDFIFEVENDKALRFKLDNISIDYVSGTTIKASFNVKGLVINK